MDNLTLDNGMPRCQVMTIEGKQCRRIAGHRPECLFNMADSLVTDYWDRIHGRESEMTEHRCQIKEVVFRDWDSFNIATFYTVDGEMYYGGLSSSQYDNRELRNIFMDSHYAVTHDGLLEIIQRVIRMSMKDNPSLWFSIVGNYWNVLLKNTLNANDLANAIHSTPEKVRRYFQATIYID